MTSPSHGRRLELFTITEVTEILRVCSRTVHRLIEKGDLRPSRVGRRVLIASDEIESFIRRGPRPRS
jgi:excisionase family DNA binding protein